MKKRYIIIPAVAVAVLALIIIISVIIVNGRYLKKLPYDHVYDRSYNGVRIVGEDGLFYLVKDEQKLSDGYSSLKSVNDFYGDTLDKHEGKQTDIVLFDYYIARRPDSENLWLVNTSGSEYMIDGDTYSLDAQSTKLPYLVFTNNQNGMKSAVSLHRLDSDISYQSGNILTLRTFKSLSAMSACPESVLCTYLATTDNAAEEQYSYFAQDGIKITTGKSIEFIKLYSQASDSFGVFFYNADEAHIISLERQVVATDVVALHRAGAADWRYAFCKNTVSGASCIITFSPEKVLTFSESQYDLSSAYDFGSCLVAKDISNSKQSITNIFSGRSAQYGSVIPNGILLTATADDGSYVYIGQGGSPITKSTYPDMVANESLSTEDCTVLTSQTAGEKYVYFAKADTETYGLDCTDILLSRLDIPDVTAYKLTKTEGDKQVFALLAPFSSVKISEYYDTFEHNIFENTSWIWAYSAKSTSYDLLDPLSAKPCLSLKSTQGTALSYSVSNEGSLSLLPEEYDEKNVTDIGIICIRAEHADNQKNSARYIALYRPSVGKSSVKSTAALELLELGYSLHNDVPFTEIDNYLVTNTSQGSDIYTLDSDSMLEYSFHIPYRISGILTDIEQKDTSYFVVSTDSGMKGIYDTSGQQVLSPYYTDILYADNGYFTVSMRGAQGVIRSGASGIKQIIDFKYTYILPLGKSGYSAVAGDGTTTVFCRNKTVIIGSVQSLEYIECYNVSSDGYLEYTTRPLISMKGNLYTYR